MTSTTARVAMLSKTRPEPLGHGKNPFPVQDVGEDGANVATEIGNVKRPWVVGELYTSRQVVEHGVHM